MTRRGLWLVWAIYDGLLLPGDLPELQGQHDWAQIIAGTYYLVYRGNQDSEHYPLCTSVSFDATQAARRAALEHGHAPPSRATPPSRTPRTPTLHSTVNVLPRAASSYSAEGAMAASLDHHSDDDEDGPFSSMPAEFSLGVPGKKQKQPCVRWCIALPPRMVK